MPSGISRRSLERGKISLSRSADAGQHSGGGGGGGRVYWRSLLAQFKSVSEGGGRTGERGNEPCTSREGGCKSVLRVRRAPHSSAGVWRQPIRHRHCTLFGKPRAGLSQTASWPRVDSCFSDSSCFTSILSLCSVHASSPVSSTSSDSYGKKFSSASRALCSYLLRKYSTVI